MSKGIKVFVGLSGGVDSSVSAALLKKAGYDVTGVFIRVWYPEWLQCDWKEERRDAMRVAAKLDIPFLTFDLREEYKKNVADYMISEYKAGRTPNPDVMCNKSVKFGGFFKKAVEMGADFVATGHYAQTQHDTNTRMQTNDTNKATRLLKGVDQNKDQSYFLWTLTQEQLQKTLFPVGNLEKTEVRKLAKKFGLATAEKKDSQGICFLGKLDMKEFLSHYIKESRGKVLDLDGEEIGIHSGALFYTLGQRHGFTITEKGTNDAPLFIVAKDVEKNTITVSPKNPEGVAGETREVELEQINWNFEIPKEGKKYTAQIRYRQEPQICTINGKRVIFEKNQGAVSPGQSLVLYDGEVCLGGGIITAARASIKKEYA